MSRWSHKYQSDRQQRILSDVNCQHELIATCGAGRTECARSVSSEKTRHEKTLEARNHSNPLNPEILAEEGERVI
jgi:hypothetical protein